MAVQLLENFIKRVQFVLWEHWLKFGGKFLSTAKVPRSCNPLLGRNIIRQQTFLILIEFFFRENSLNVVTSTTLINC